MENLNNLDRLKIELNHQQYYTENDYMQFLIENGLDPNNQYIKKENQAQLLQTVVDILDSLMNNIDNFRKIQTEFSTTTEAYSYLKDRIDQLERKIATICAVNNDTNTNTTTNNITFMYHC